MPRRPDQILLRIVVLAALLVGCDGRGSGIPAGRGQTGWGVAEIPFEPEDHAAANDPVPAQPRQDWNEAEQENEPVRNADRRKRRRSWGFDESGPSDTLPSQTELWDTDREKPSDNMPSRSFPSFSREPLPSESNDSNEPDE